MKEENSQIEKLCEAAVIDDLERRLDAALHALFLMVQQYCGTERKTLDGLPFYEHYCMSAGEEACQVLQDEGRITNEQW